VNLTRVYELNKSSLRIGLVVRLVVRLVVSCLNNEIMGPTLHANSYVILNINTIRPTHSETQLTKL